MTLLLLLLVMAAGSFLVQPRPNEGSSTNSVSASVYDSFVDSCRLGNVVHCKIRRAKTIRSALVRSLLLFDDGCVR